MYAIRSYYDRLREFSDLIGQRIGRVDALQERDLRGGGLCLGTQLGHSVFLDRQRGR